MPKTVTASEAKNRLGALLGWVVEHQDEIIVESHGEPKAVIVAFDEYEKLSQLKERQRRQDALERMRELRAEVSERNQDLSEAAALELADRVVREVVDDMVAEGSLRFDHAP